MILMIISGLCFLGGGYIWVKVLNAFRSRRAQKRPLIEAEIAGIVIGIAFVMMGVFFLRLGMTAINSLAF